MLDRNVLFEAPVPNVSNDSDHRQPRGVLPLHARRLEPFADRILPWPEPLGHRPIHQCNARGPGVISRGEEPAAKERNAHRPEIVVTYDVVSCARADVRLPFHGNEPHRARTERE